MHPESDQFSRWGNFSHLKRQSGIHLKSPHREGEDMPALHEEKGVEGGRGKVRPVSNYPSPLMGITSSESVSRVDRWEEMLVSY